MKLHACLGLKSHGMDRSNQQDNFRKKKLRVTDYLLNISTSGVPLDEIGILIVSRMYDLKVCVLMKDHYWCPLNNSSIDDSEIKIAFRGNLRFSDTKLKGKIVKQAPSPSPLQGKATPAKPTWPKGPAKELEPTLSKTQPSKGKKHDDPNAPKLSITTHGTPKRKRPIQHYKCPAGCKDKMFKSQKDLNEHVNTKHPNCSICLKTFLNKKCMEEHKKVHTK